MVFSWVIASQAYWIVPILKDIAQQFIGGQFLYKQPKTIFTFLLPPP